MIKLAARLEDPIFVMSNSQLCGMKKAKGKTRTYIIEDGKLTPKKGKKRK